MDTLTKQDTTTFQTWYNDSLPKGKAPLTVDGIYGPKTSSAYTATKDAFDNRITIGRMLLPRLTLGSLLGIAAGAYIIHRIRKTEFKHLKPTIAFPLYYGILVVGNTMGQFIQNEISN